MTTTIELLLIAAYLGVVLWVVKIAGKVGRYYWLAAVVAFVGIALLEWQDADTDRRIAERDRQHVAEVAR